MSKIDELIAELCPKGVEYRDLGEVVQFRRGKTITKQETLNGNIPVIAGGQKPSYFHNEANRDGETITVAGSGAYAGFVNYWRQPIFVSDAFTVDPDLSVLLPRFVYFFLTNLQEEIHKKQTGGGIPHVYGKDLAKFQIPIPPISIQLEVIEKLNAFTELETELEAELTARRKQFHFYRNLLLLFPSEMELQHMELGDLGSVSMCKRVLKNQTTSEGEIPFFKIGTFGKEPDAYISRDLFQTLKAQYSFPKVGSVLISAAGTIGRTVRYSGEEEYFQDSNIVWIENDESVVTNGYLWHFLQTVKWETDGGTIKRLYNHRIQSTAISVPDLASQNEIVEILDSLEAFIYSPIGSLKSELDARRKQFEYYRDKLLTFKELAA